MGSTVQSIRVTLKVDFLGGGAGEGGVRMSQIFGCGHINKVEF